MAGLPELKVRRLHGIAEAALAGRLDAGRLRGLEPAAALEELQTLEGIGPFFAMLVLVRSTGHADVLAENEPRLLRCVAHYYGRDDLPALAEPWRPFRTWAGVLIRYAGGREGVA
jgi:DNA-3-methyladenine glycosylase II